MLRMVRKILLVSVLLSACGLAEPEPAPSATPAPTATAVPTQTLSPTSTDVAAGETVNVNNYFSFQLPEDYLHSVEENQVAVFGAGGFVLIAMAISPEPGSAAEVFDAVVGNIGPLDVYSSETVHIDGHSAEYFSFKEQGAESFEGGYVMLILEDGREFFAFGTGLAAIKAWELGGAAAFHYILNSIRFPPGDAP